MKAILITCLVLILTACAATPTATPAAPAGGIKITDAWVRYSPGAQQMGAAYFVINNPGGADDTLLSVAADVASMAEMHQTIQTNGAMQMSPVQSVIVPAGGRTEFRPGGYHVMLMGLTRDLKTGDKVKLTLTFKSAGAITIVCEVRDQ